MNPWNNYRMHHDKLKEADINKDEVLCWNNDDKIKSQETK